MGSVIKNLLANTEDGGSVPGWGRSGEGSGNSFQYSCLGNPIQRDGISQARSLVDYSTEKPGGLQSMGLQKSEIPLSD